MDFYILLSEIDMKFNTNAQIIRKDRKRHEKCRGRIKAKIMVERAQREDMLRIIARAAFLFIKV